MNSTKLIVKKIKNLKEVENQITKFNNSSDYGNVFHTIESMFFFNRITELDYFVLAVYDEHKGIKSLASTFLNQKIILSAVKLNWVVIEGGVVLAENRNKNSLYLKELIKFIDNTFNNAVFIEIRNLNDYTAFKGVFKECGWDYIPYLNYHVDCTDIAKVKKNMSNSKIRQVKKSLKNGAEIIDNPNEQQVAEFYKILKYLYQTKVKKPLPELEFFLEFHRSEMGKYFLIKYNEEIVGGIMSPIFKNRCVYEWYVAGEDRKYKNIYPSILATWAAIEYAAKNNIPRFDFMGAGKPNEYYGVREFKSKFGGELVEHGRFIKINKKLTYKLGNLLINLMQKR